MSRCSIHRRELLRASAIAAAGLALSPGAAVLAENPKKKVVVLGAGLAGLAAAWELKQSGQDVVVVEAQRRAGGRVLTLRDGFPAGLSAEAGAMSFSDSYRYLVHYVRLFDVPHESLATAAVRSASGTALYYLRGTLFTARDGESVAWPYDLSAEERALGQAGILSKYVVSALDATGDPAQPYALPDWARSYDQQTLLELAAQRGASPGARELIRSTFWFADREDRESAAASLLSSISLFYRGQTAYGFPQGVDSLPLAFASRLQDRILYGTEVVRIEQSRDHVEVVVQVGETLNRLMADRVICTIPFPVLRNIETIPPFSESKREVVSDLKYRSVTRVYLQVRERFWERADVPGRAMTDLPIAQVQEHPIIRTGAEEGRSILEAHVRGDAALTIDAMAEHDRLRFVLAEMEKVHPGVTRYYEGGQSKSWQDDPWARGAYTSFRPGQVTAWLPRIARPEGRVHFAGEHTSIFSGTMEGAIESGIRAAREIEEA